MPKDSENIGIIVQGLADNPTIFKHLIDANYFSAAISQNIATYSAAFSLYNSLKEQNIPLDKTNIATHLLRNGLLEHLANIEPDQAKGILHEVLKSSFATEQGLSSIDPDNLNLLSDKTVELIHSLKTKPEALTNLGEALAHRIEIQQELSLNTNPLEAKKLESIANIALVTKLLDAAETPETQNSLLDFAAQVAKTIDDNHQVINAKSLQDVKKIKIRIQELEAQLSSNVIDPNKHNDLTEKKLIFEDQIKAKEDEYLSKHSELDTSLKSLRMKLKDIEDSDLHAGINAIIQGIEEEKLRAEEKFLKESFPIKQQVEKIDVDLKANELTPEIREQITSQIASFKEQINLNPLDNISLELKDRLKLNPGELTRLEELGRGNIVDLLSNRSLTQQLAKLPLLTEEERFPELKKLTPELLENQARSLDRLCNDQEFQSIVRNNPIVIEQAAAQGFRGVEDKAITETFNLYPIVISPALRDRKLLSTALDSEASIGSKVSAALDFLGRNREALPAVLTSSFITDSALNTSLVKQVITDPIQQQDALTLAPLLTKHKEALIEMANILIQNAETVETIISAYEQTQPRMQSEEQTIKPSYTQKDLEELGLTHMVGEIAHEDLQQLVNAKRNALKIHTEQLSLQPTEPTTANPSHNTQSQDPVVDKTTINPSLSVTGNSPHSSLSEAQVPTTQQVDTYSMFAKASRLLEEHKDFVPSVITYAKEVAIIVLPQKEKTKTLVNAGLAYKSAPEEEKAFHVSNLLSAAIDLAKDKQVIAATEKFLNSNTKTLEEILDGKIKTPLGTLSGKFCVKLFKKANTPEGLESLDRLVKEPSFAKAWNVLTTTGSPSLALATYFAAKESEKRTKQSLKETLVQHNDAKRIYSTRDIPNACPSLAKGRNAIL